MNIDSKEINKFSDLASRWWDVNSEFKPLHSINPLRLNYVNERSPLANKKVVDIGCGGGILSESMAHMGAEVLGIDMGEAPLEAARLHALENKVMVAYKQTTAEQLAQESPEGWDIVTCMEMLEHVPDPASVVKACAKLVKPDGYVYFSTINRNPKAFLLAIVGAEYILRLLPKGTHQYEKFIKPNELHEWCEQVQLEPQSIIGIHYNPLIDAYKLAPGVDVNYILYCKKPHNH